MSFFKKHADTAVVIATILTVMIWMHSEVKEVKNEFRIEFKEIHKEIAAIKSDLSDVRREVTVVKTVLIMKNIMPPELARAEVQQ